MRALIAFCNLVIARQKTLLYFARFPSPLKGRMVRLLRTVANCVVFATLGTSRHFLVASEVPILHLGVASGWFATRPDVIGGVIRTMNLLAKLVAASQTVPSDTVALLRRIIAEQGTKHWRAYAGAYALMAVAAGCTAASAYIVGYAVNTVYQAKETRAIVATCIVIMVIFVAKGLATYGQAVTIATINSTIASEYKIR